MIGFILVTGLFIGILVGFSKLLDVQKIKENWAEYRCRPDVMFLADFYGHDSMENLNFCLSSTFLARSKISLSPFYTYLAKFIEILITFLKSLNSIRMVFATIVGSVSQISTEFFTRFKALLFRIQNNAIRMKFLMGRIFGTMVALMYMGYSGLKAVTNFGNTSLFSFIDGFCFDPNTKVILQGGREVCVKDVCIGDFFASGERVTATFEFFSDGQPMVLLPGNILVSTNHYLLHNQKWIQAKVHPDAKSVEPWAGGYEKPLICFNTDKHTFTIGSYCFRDYDETEDGDKETMKEVLKQLNNSEREEFVPQTYNTVIAPKTKIKTQSGVIPADQICLGTPLKNGTVVGIIEKECNFFVKYKGETFGEGTCIWSDEEKKWIRPAATSTKALPRKFLSFVVSPSACIETEAGTVIRDYVEIHSPDTEQAYTKALNNTSKES